MKREEPVLLKNYPRLKGIGVSHDIAGTEYDEYVLQKETNRTATLRAPDEVVIYFQVDDPNDWSGLPKTLNGYTTSLIKPRVYEPLMNNEPILGY
jgi:hypothetical protein